MTLFLATLPTNSDPFLTTLQTNYKLSGHPPNELQISFRSPSQTITDLFLATLPANNKPICSHPPSELQIYFWPPSQRTIDLLLATLPANYRPISGHPPSESQTYFWPPTILLGIHNINTNDMVLRRHVCTFYSSVRTFITALSWLSAATRTPN